MKLVGKEDLVMKKLIIGGLAGLFVIVLVAVAAMAGPGWRCNENGSCGGCGAGGIYDPAKIEVITGQVVSVEKIKSRRGPSVGVVLTVDTGSETRTVHLGPLWYLEQQKVQIASGDMVEIEGADTARRRGTVFLAAEIKKGNEVLILRDENGVPAWAGPRCKQSV
jgi:hypothetical protein